VHAAPTATVEPAVTEATTTSAPEDAPPGEIDSSHDAGVASANSHATGAGIAILEEGGSAIDAAIAVQAVLGLVEPQSSGLGGGAFMLYYDAETQVTTAYDGREEAPSAATPELFLDENGDPLGFVEATGSGRAVGSPGVVAMLQRGHAEHGELEWGASFRPAIEIARAGFDVSARMADALALMLALGASDEAAQLFSNDAGEPLVAGDLFVNGAYAETLDEVSAGWRAFYEGEIAAQIVAATAAEPLPGSLSLEDLASYEAREGEVLCGPYGEWTVCGPPPPSSGGVAVLSLLGQLDAFELSTAGPTTEDWHQFIEASQRAYADRDEYVGDDHFVDVPLEEMLDPAYLAARAATIDPNAATPVVEAGVVEGFERGADATDEPSGTSHFTVVDREGNVVSMTTSVESVFGSRRVAGGFVLNNQLTDFSFTPTDEFGPVANAVEARKRPRSLMSPTIVFEKDDPVIALGSPGGSSIIAYVSKTLVGVLDWGLSRDEAIALPNVVARNGSVTVEESPESAELIAALEGLGHVVQDSASENSGIHLIELQPDSSISGSADPRREGTFVQVP
jgi:gamma-glutamyltranspeptidase/glutathione hydrolase